VSRAATPLFGERSLVTFVMRRTLHLGLTGLIDIYDAREPGRVHKSIALNEASKLIQQLRRDFKDVALAK
jgi:hypothetical protein